MLFRSSRTNSSTAWSLISDHAPASSSTEPSAASSVLEATCLRTQSISAKGPKSEKSVIKRHCWHECFQTILEIVLEIFRVRGWRGNGKHHANLKKYCLQSSVGGKKTASLKSKEPKMITLGSSLHLPFLTDLIRNELAARLFTAGFFSHFF